MARKKELDEAERKKELLRKLRKGPDLDKYVDDKKRRYQTLVGEGSCLLLSVTSP
ncbi:hypothetical protein [Butyrivibrio sp. AE3006]|uniref:hypothetical protein n=1 Tax=Butyrivibrio sp. AE3006 TaxID=1280673 RepID=UPI0012DEE01D|nr:hypothetical protein [Butyrivibrio sp. AE3006]